MTATLFLAFLALMTAISVILIARYMNGRTAAHVFAGLLIWLLFIGFLGYSGIARKTTIRPPGTFFILGPVLTFLIFFIVQTSNRIWIALAFPLWLTISAQSFRVGVELFLHRLSIEGLIPKMLTFEGANLDIYIGASAPLIAWLSTRRTIGVKVALAWSMLGVLVLANVVFRAVLTAPGPLNLIHAERPDLMIGTFPFLFIPGFFVPLAVVLHVLSIQKISSQLRS